MKKNKLILMILIAFVFGLTLNVKALDITTDSTKVGTVDTNSYLVTNTGSINITGSVSDDLRALKILDVFYNKNTNVMTYEFTSDFQAFLKQNSTYKNLTVDDYYNLTSGDITSGSVLTNSTLDKLVSAYTSYIWKNNKTLLDSAYLIEYYSENGVYSARGTVPVGAYLIVGNKTHGFVLYGVMVGNVVPTATNGVWTIQNADIVAKVSSTGSVCRVSLADENATDDDVYVYIGEEVLIKSSIRVPVFPTNSISRRYEAEFFADTVITVVEDMKKYRIVAMIGEDEVEFSIASDGTVTAPDGSVAGKITVSNQKVTFLPDLDYYQHNSLYAINQGLVYNIYVPVKLNDTADYYGRGNDLGIYITQTHNPYESASDSNTDENGCYFSLYTLAMEILAYENNNTSNVLSDVEFEVYSDEMLTNKIGTIKTDSTGRGELKGLKKQTYYIKNAKTRAGYKLAPLTSVNVTDYVTVKIPISKTGLLPVTGGIGTIIYTAIGLGVIIGAVIVYTVYKKKKNMQMLSD